MTDAPERTQGSVPFDGRGKITSTPNEDTTAGAPERTHYADDETLAYIAKLEQEREKHTRQAEHAIAKAGEYATEIQRLRGENTRLKVNAKVWADELSAEQAEAERLRTARDRWKAAAKRNRLAKWGWYRTLVEHRKAAALHDEGGK